MTDKKMLKSEKLRLKNDRLRAQGKDPLKGSNPMVNTGVAGINKVNIGIRDDSNTTSFMDKTQRNFNTENACKDDNR
ncbi:hypothetical protein [Vagococcus hydrophili]|uniref:Uncharacterized protein n=1 Tax=Vagococcus hydrophili TaxID=2714947 RepID=A0A6G8ASW0_9ENTE|nr:hypothetical protein [Vagococcus hydrophili]QIL48161.1 hypothetical protein G7082_06490 [Vagococcus hydrophili]